MTRNIVVIAHNIRSAHNIGSLLRTADGLGVEYVHLTGYSPFPLSINETRLPHIAQRVDRLIAKTALGAEKHVPWQHNEDVAPTIAKLKHDGYTVCALEQTDTATPLPDFTVPTKVALILGNEVDGIDEATIGLADSCLVIPMVGSKESYNVVQAAAMALYHCKFMS